MVGAYHVPLQLVLQNKDDEDIGLLFQGVCMYEFVAPMAWTSLHLWLSFTAKCPTIGPACDCVCAYSECVCPIESRVV